MAVTVGTSSSTNAVSSSLTFAHDATGADMLVVGAGERSTASAATYNGVSMTALTAVTNTAVVNARQFWLASPATGSNNVVVTFGASTQVTAGATNFSGSDGTVGAVSTATGSSTGVTGGNVTGGVGSSIIDFVSHGNDATNTVVAPQVQAYQIIGPGNTQMASTQAGSASPLHNDWTSAVLSIWASSSVAVNPSTAVTTGNFFNFF